MRHDLIVELSECIAELYEGLDELRAEVRAMKVRPGGADERLDGPEDDLAAGIEAGIPGMRYPGQHGLSGREARRERRNAIQQIADTLEGIHAAIRPMLDDHRRPNGDS